MTLVHRVETLDPRGGRFGLGLIRAEADIHPDDWFLICHFVDDRVMPGTLMYECCLHTLRIFLMRMGWVGRAGAGRVRAGAGRGQPAAVPGAGDRVDPEGHLRGRRSRSWATAPSPTRSPTRSCTPTASRSSRSPTWRCGSRARDRERARAALASRIPQPRAAPVATGADQPVCDSTEQILAFATGRPSDAFGERYRPFDDGRFIARLPRPPYSVPGPGRRGRTGEPWAMAAGTAARAEYDVPADAWYFAADRQDRVPYAVLLEAALQPCGWLVGLHGLGPDQRPSRSSSATWAGPPRQHALARAMVGHAHDPRSSAPR